MPEPVPEWLTDLKDEAAAKKAIIRHMFDNRPEKPADVEKAFQRFCAMDEIQRNLAALDQICAKVVYRPVDIRQKDRTWRLFSRKSGKNGARSKG